STYAQRAEIDLSRLVVDEITLIGSRCGPFTTALERLRQGLDPRPLIEGRYPLAAAVTAFAQAAQPGALKILLDCSPGCRPPHPLHNPTPEKQNGTA
ncbi:MAG: hypothetical protein KA125_13715, partial [Chromatiaceae bacterium]|nr:hypothetical protein [Chromatiaceae bacterium]